MSQALPYSLEQLQNAFGYVESSNRYDAIGPETRRGDNAYGRYQVMDFNVPSWSEQYYGQRLTPQEFLANPQAQDAVFYGRMGEYYSQGQGAPEDRVRNAARCGLRVSLTAQRRQIEAMALSTTRNTATAFCGP